MPQTSNAKIRTGIVQKNVDHAGVSPAQDEWSCSGGMYRDVGGRGIILLLAAILVCAQLSFARAGEFATRFEEYEFHSGAWISEQEDEAAVTCRVRKGDSVCTIARTAYPPTGSWMKTISPPAPSAPACMLRTPQQNNRENPSARKRRPKRFSRPSAPMRNSCGPSRHACRPFRRGEGGRSPRRAHLGKAGAKVVSARAPGVVEKVGRMRGFGTFVVVRHSDRLITVYACLGEVSVRRGDAMKGEGVGKLPGGREFAALHGEPLGEA